jgi:hypothetical protein
MTSIALSDFDAARQRFIDILVDVYEVQLEDAAVIATPMLRSVLELLVAGSETNPIDRLGLLSGTRKLVEAVHLSCLTICQGHRYDWLTARGMAVLELLRSRGIETASKVLL